MFYPFPPCVLCILVKMLKITNDFYVVLYMQIFCEDNLLSYTALHNECVCVHCLKVSFGMHLPIYVCTVTNEFGISCKFAYTYSYICTASLIQSIILLNVRLEYSALSLQHFSRYMSFHFIIPSTNAISCTYCLVQQLTTWHLNLLLMNFLYLSSMLVPNPKIVPVELSIQ